MSLHNDTSSAEDRRLVKVYEMSGPEWFDRGTGLCHAVNSHECPTIYVESEETPGRMLLETKVYKKDMFQKQQDTLIVWTDLDGVDMALSFQTPIGCASIWDFVHSAQDTYFQANSQDDSLSDDPLDDYAGHFSLPFTPTFGNLPEIEQRIQLAATLPNTRASVIKYILNNQYLPKLLPLVQEAEDLESLEDLHRFCNIMKHIILLNDNNIMELIVSDAVIDGVLTALEYDPDFPTHKANHRQFLNDKSRFREVIPLRNPAMLRQIRQVWRLQYLRDVVLARSVDEPTFSVINSLVYLNQISIVQHLQSNNEFLCELFSVFDKRYPDIKKKEDAIRFIHQCATISKNIQHNARNNLLSSFISHGLFSAIHFAVRYPTSFIRTAGVDILSVLLDHDPVVMRRFALKSLDEETYIPLTDTLIEVLHGESDLGVKMQLSDALKTLLEPTMFVQDPLGRPMTHLLNRSINRHHNSQRTSTEDDDTPASAAGVIMRRHFDLSMKKLFEPFHELEDRRDSIAVKGVTHPESALYEHLIDILNFFVRSHVSWGRRFLYEERLVPQVTQMLTVPYKKVLTLTAVKFFRALIALNDTFFIGQMTQNRVFEILLDMVYNNMPRDNLLNSTCLEFFEYIVTVSSSSIHHQQTAAFTGGHNNSNNDNPKSRDHSGVFMRPIVVHLVELYREKMEKITYVDTFTIISSIYDSIRGTGEDMDTTEVLDVSSLQQQQQELEQMQLEQQQSQMQQQQEQQQSEGETRTRDREDDEVEEDKRDVKRVKRLGKSFGALKEERNREANALEEHDSNASSDGEEEEVDDDYITHGKRRPLEQEKLWLDRRTPSAGLQVSHPGSPVLFASKPLVEYDDDDDLEQKGDNHDEELQSSEPASHGRATDEVLDHSSPPDKSFLDAIESAAAPAGTGKTTTTPLSPSPSSSVSPPSSPSPSPSPSIDRNARQHDNLGVSPGISPTKDNNATSPSLPQDQIVRRLTEKRRREADDEGDISDDDGHGLRKVRHDKRNGNGTDEDATSQLTSPRRRQYPRPRSKRGSFSTLNAQSPSSPSKTTSPALPPSSVMTTPTAAGPRKVTPFIRSATEHAQSEEQTRPQSQPPIPPEQSHSPSKPQYRLDPSSLHNPDSKSPPTPSSPKSPTTTAAAAANSAAVTDEPQVGSPDPGITPLVAPRKMRRLGSRKISFSLSGAFQKAATRPEKPQYGPLQQQIQKEKQGHHEEADNGIGELGKDADVERGHGRGGTDGGKGDEEMMHVDEEGG